MRIITPIRVKQAWQVTYLEWDAAKGESITRTRTFGEKVDALRMMDRLDRPCGLDEIGVKV